ncbi:tetratricopeptide repeat protein [Candidatus Sumerlaeota bacterium]|nr:tetratricopeptide repeat protein [Candidatus Sumerlaeota bacterium]
MGKVVRRSRLSREKVSFGPRSHAAPPSASNLPPVIVLLISAFLAYVPALSAGYVWDDSGLTNNPLMLSAGGLWKIWTSPMSNLQEDHYWPLPYTTFWFEHKLWGFAPLGYHFDNVLLHAVNAVLLLLILRALRVRGSWFAAMIFALHPVHAESVAWVIERKYLLCVLFYFSAALAYLRFEGERRSWIYAAALSCFILSMLSKSAGVGFPFAMALLLWWKRGRLRGGDWLRLTPFAAVSVLLTLFDLHWVGKHEGFITGMSFAERIGVASRGLWFYASKFFLPSNLMAIYPKWEPEMPAGILFALLAAAATAACCLALLRGKSRGLAVCVGFYILTLAPVLGFMDFGYMLYSFVADRYQYLASAGLAVLAGGILAGILDRISIRIPLARAGAASLLFASMGAITFSQAAIYKNKETLFRPNTIKNPSAWGAFNNAATELLDSNRNEEAIAYLKGAIQLRPNFEAAHYNLGKALAQLSRHQEALAAFDQTLLIAPNYVLAHYMRGASLIELGRFDEAIAAFQTALKIKPDYAEAHYAIGVAFSRQGRDRDAETAFRQALAIQPNYPDAMNNLAVNLMNLGRTAEAREMLEKALQLNPATPNARENLARAQAILSAGAK